MKANIFAAAASSCQRLAYALVISGAASAYAADDCRITYTYETGSGKSLRSQTETKSIKPGQRVRLNKPGILSIANLHNPQVRFEFTPQRGVQNVTLRRNQRHPSRGTYTARPTLASAVCINPAPRTSAARTAPAAKNTTANPAARTVVKTAQTKGVAAQSAMQRETTRRTPDQPDQLAALQARVSELESKITMLLNIIQVNGADVRLASLGKLTIEAAQRMQIESGQNLILQADTGMDVKSKTNMLVQSLTGLRLKGSANVDVDAGATLNLKGALVKKNQKLFPTVSDFNSAVITGACPPTGGPLIAGKLVVIPTN